MENILTFEQLPNAVSRLTEEVCELKRLLLTKPNEKPQQQEEKLLSVKEAAEFLKLTVPTIYSKVSRKELPYMKRGKYLYFSTKELMAYLKEGKVLSNAEVQAEADGYLNQ